MAPEELREFLTRSRVTASARRLLGCEIVAPDCRIRIVETEAYGGPEDLGSHGCRGVTPRTVPMFGRAGHAYVYFTYGNHWMLNVSCRREGESGAVLIRAAVPLEGINEMWSRRPRAKRERDLLSGPGKIAAAIGISGAHSGLDLLEKRSPYRLVVGPPVKKVLVTTRIGLSPGCGEDLPWRFVDAANSEWASR